MDNTELLRKTYALVKENNRLLKSMRRRAFVGGMMKLVFWAGMILIPWWIYTQSIAPLLEQSREALSQVSGVSDAGVGQLQGILDTVRNIDVTKLKELTGQGQ